jgi:phosphatidate cytidylyltransferase
MKRILTAIVLIVLVLAVVFYDNLWLVTAVAGVVAILAALEFRQFAAAGGCPLPLWWTIFAIAAFFLATFRAPASTIAVVSMVTLVLFSWSALRTELQCVLWQTAAGVLMLVYIAYPLTLLPQILNEENGTAYGRATRQHCTWASGSGGTSSLRNFLRTRHGREPRPPWRGPARSGWAWCCWGILPR